jgi:hypothetical protein
VRKMSIDLLMEEELFELRKLEMELYLVVKIPKKDFEKLPADLKKLLTESIDTFLYITENGEVVERYGMGVCYG